ncbi:MAG TPA: hypothetical protein VFW24_17035, partial [Acidimicrobiales bacterium]|nr:hypothetical protein [Acidimicrobiales bacterium]
MLAGAGAAVVLASAAAAGALAIGGGSAPPRTAPPAHRRAAPAPSGPVAGTAVHPAATPPPPAPAPVPAAPAAPPATAAPTDLPLPGCPPPPYTGPPPAPPWHPAHLVPDSQLPPAPGAPPGRNPTAAISGKGMWIWQLSSTDHGDVSAIVADATRAGLQQIWVRVGDSPDGFYGGPALTTLVPAAHRAGLKVIGWGFPYLFDPVADAGWTRSAIQWRSADGQGLDGWSADLETASEGVALSPQRVAVYLGEVRSAAPHTLLVATVFPPTDDRMTKYPYGTMAPYVDAYAPMLYWGCTQPVL